MTLRDLIDVSMRNLALTKLRAALTIAGVVIAIATFVAMLSFAAGNQRYFTTAFREFGLLSQMNVTANRDTAAVVPLDNAAVRALAKIPGVRLAYPYSTFTVTAAIHDTTVSTSARALPAAALDTKLFARVLGGYRFSSATAPEAIVTDDFVELAGLDSDALPGSKLIVSMQVARFDSALAATWDGPFREAKRLRGSIDPDSILSREYRQRFLQRELSNRMTRFFDGLMNRQATVSDTLVILGVARRDRKYDLQTSPIVITDRTAERLSAAGVVLGGNPADVFAAVKDGRLFDAGGEPGNRSYPRVTLELEPLANPKAVKDSVVALGFRASSFAETFAEMQRFMVYFYLGMGVIGMIALMTAALGIINTMVMSITERRREIGILKSLGADERDIRQLFLAESGVIGLVGAATGVLLGWIATRIAAMIARVIMEREDMPVFDPFALPPWLVVTALVFGVLVSVIAGLYPAARAARVDPVEALRSE